MAEQTSPLVLGSASPRRSALLQALGIDFTIATVDLDEHALLRAGEEPAISAARIAQAKFAAFGSDDSMDAPWLLTADTLVASGGVSMGKPTSAAHLHQMLTDMSSQAITVASAVCVGERGSTPAPRTVITKVGLRQLQAEEIAEYVASGAGDDKAGGLALQAEARPFIASVQGCWSNVLGLPVCAVAAALDLPPAGQTREQRCSVELCGTHER